MQVSIKAIIKNMPQNLTGIEKVRYLYLEIGKIISYNIEYIYYINTRFAKDIYDEIITIDDIEKGNYQNKITLVCKQASEILCEALNEINIKSTCIGFEDGEQYHVDVLVNIDNKIYCLDIMRDAKNIQKGFKTRRFATTKELYNGMKCNTIKQENIKEMDKKLGYCKKIYMDDSICMLKEEMSNTENIKRYILEENYELKNKITKDTIFKYKIEFIYKYIKNNLLEEDKMEIMELKYFYKRIFREVLSESEQDRCKIYDFSYKNDNKIIYSMVSKIKFEKQSAYYIYDDEKRGFVKTDKEKLKDLLTTINFFEEETEYKK